MEIAVITPPVAINLYVLKAQFLRRTWKILSVALWYLIIDIPILIILIAFPSISLGCPVRFSNPVRRGFDAEV
jgi:TRAP-type C4-dicarboxylate transport system permease large subunit